MKKYIIIFLLQMSIYLCCYAKVDTDSLNLIIKISYPSVALPPENRTLSAPCDTSLLKLKSVAFYKYELDNNTDDYVILWFGQDDFFLYMFRPLFPLSIMDILHENGSTLCLGDSTFSIPFFTFYKIINPHEKFHVYIYDESNEYSENIIQKSIRYISRKNSFLLGNDQDFELLVPYSYQGTEIVLNMKLFLYQPLWVRGSGLNYIKIE